MTDPLCCPPTIANTRILCLRYLAKFLPTAKINNPQAHNAFGVCIADAVMINHPSAASPKLIMEGNV